MSLTKHVDETEEFGIDFNKELGANESMSNPEIKVTKKQDDGTWADKTSEFGTPSPSVSGDIITFTLDAASSGDQDNPPYLIYCKVNTDQGRILVETVGLYTYDTGKV